MTDDIRVRTGGTERTFTTADAPITIGTGPGVTVPIASTHVAALHATIDASGSRWSVVAAPGASMYLAGQPVARASVGGAVQLRLGHPELGAELAVATAQVPLPSEAPVDDPERTLPNQARPGPAPAGPPPQRPTPVAGNVDRRGADPGTAPTIAATVGGVDLTVHHGGTERTFPPGHVVTIGRNVTNDIVLANPLVSGQHAQIRYGATGWELIDSGSKHGTWIHGDRISTRALTGVTTAAFAGDTNGEKVMIVAPGATVAPPEPPRAPGGAKTPLLVGIGVVAVLAFVVVLLVVTRSNDPEPSAANVVVDAPADLAGLKRATVKIQGFDADGASWTGSGTVISSDGLILTNAHVADPSAEGIEDGPAPERLIVSVNEAGNDDPVEPRFVAEAVAVDGYKDLAVIQIVATLGGKEVDASDYAKLHPAPVGSSTAMSSGDEIIVMGFPAVAESKSVTVTSGRFSSRADGPGGKNQYINTDAKFDHGNSGGLAANDAGEIIGVPTREDRSDPSCNKVATDGKGNPVYDCDSDRQGRLVAIDMAEPLIAAARSGTPYEPDPGS